MAKTSPLRCLCYTAAQNMGRLTMQDSMTIQQWCFSFKGRIGRRDFWIWIGLSAVLVKRLHDRNKAGWWALLLILAWMLAAGNWQMLAPLWQWGVGRFIPTLIIVMMVIDLGAFVGTPEDNRFGPPPEPVKFRAE
jgi:uncharacterized membrane protein YhaH (DUF805 family)